MGIKAVIFDYGGVICFSPSHGNTDELERLTGLPADTLQELHQKYRGDWDRGTCSGIEYYRQILTSSGIFLDDSSLARIVQADLDGWKGINPGTEELIRELKTIGLTPGILSNMPCEFYTWAKDNLAIFSNVKISVISCNYNIIKPEAGIYQLLQEQIGCDYGEIIFFDDTAANVAAARELGIKAFVWEGPDAARELITDRIK